MLVAIATLSEKSFGFKPKDSSQKVLNKGDKYGSAFNEILDYYHIENKDLTKITEDMAQNWLERK